MENDSISIKATPVSSLLLLGIFVSQIVMFVLEEQFPFCPNNFFEWVISLWFLSTGKNLEKMIGSFKILILLFLSNGLDILFRTVILNFTDQIDQLPMTTLSSLSVLLLFYCIFFPTMNSSLVTSFSDKSFYCIFLSYLLCLIFLVVL